MQNYYGVLTYNSWFFHNPQNYMCYRLFHVHLINIWNDWEESSRIVYINFWTFIDIRKFTLHGCKKCANKKRMGWDWVQPLMSSMVIPSSWASRAIWCHSLRSQDLAPQAPPAQKIRKLGSQLCGRLCIHVRDSNRELASPLKSIEYLEDCRWWKTRSRMENVNNSESSS